MFLKISVIVPVYNMEIYLEQCLDSILMQTLKDIEIICIDDGSSDKSLEILSDYSKQHKQFVIISQDNQGPACARNKGIELAKGKYIAFMDPDDWYPTDDILQSLYENAEEQKVLICGGSFSSSLNGVVNKVYRGEYAGYTFSKPELISYADYQYDYGYTRFIYDRELILNHDIYFPNYRRFQDPPFFVKAMCIAEKFYAIPLVTYCYRRGHQDYNWSEEKTVDALKGLTDDLALSQKYNLEKLHAHTTLRFGQDFLAPTSKYLSLGSRNVFYTLICANALVEIELLRKADIAEIDDDYLIAPLAQFLSNNSVDDHAYDAQLWELKCIKNSLSYRVGRIITLIPRKIRGGIHCIKDHGFLYTLYYFFTGKWN